MSLPADVDAIRRRMLAAFPPPLRMAPSDAKDETFRQWCIRLAEQLTYSLPGQGWGVKRADPGRPISKDTIARQQGGRLLVWDLFSGVGTPDTSVVDAPSSEDITGQTFVSVAPRNHLGTDIPNPPPPPPSGGDLEQRLAAIERKLSAMSLALGA